MERVEALNMGVEIGWRGTPPVVVKESNRTELTPDIQKECDTFLIEI